MNFISDLSLQSFAKTVESKFRSAVKSTHGGSKLSRYGSDIYDLGAWGGQELGQETLDQGDRTQTIYVHEIVANHET